MATHTYGLLDIEEARYLSNLVGVEYDLRTTVEWCHKYSEVLNDRELGFYIEPLTTAILVRFMRAFGSGVRNKAARHLLDFLSDQEKVDYDYYRDFRDMHIAHSINQFEENYVRAYYTEERIGDGIYSINTGCRNIVGLSQVNVAKIVKICNTLLIKINEEIKTEKENLLKIVKKYSTEDILKLNREVPKSPAKIDVSKRRS